MAPGPDPYSSRHLRIGMSTPYLNGPADTPLPSSQRTRYIRQHDTRPLGGRPYLHVGRAAAAALPTDAACPECGVGTNTTHLRDISSISEETKDKPAWQCCQLRTTCPHAYTARAARRLSGAGTTASLALELQHPHGAHVALSAYPQHEGLILSWRTCPAALDPSRRPLYVLLCRAVPMPSTPYPGDARSSPSPRPPASNTPDKKYSSVNSDSPPASPRQFDLNECPASPVAVDLSLTKGSKFPEAGPDVDGTLQQSSPPSPGPHDKPRQDPLPAAMQDSDDEEEDEQMKKELRQLVEAEKIDPNEYIFKTKRKHMFIFSDAGKPIWSRYTDAAEIADMFGAMLTITAFFRDSGDNIRRITAGEHTIVFAFYGPIYFVMVSATGIAQARDVECIVVVSASVLSSQSLSLLTSTLTIFPAGEPPKYLYRQIHYLHSLVVSVLTSAFKQRLVDKAGWDMRNLLGGTDSTFNDLMHAMSHDPGIFLSAYYPLPLPKSVRQQIGQIMSQHKTDETLFALLIFKNFIIQMITPPKTQMHVQDTMLLLHFTTSNKSVRSSQTWAPICLPNYNEKGFLWAFIDFFDGDVGLVLLSNSAEQFPELSTARTKIFEDLQSQKLLGRIRSATKKSTYSLQDVGFNTRPSDPMEVRHFIYKATGKGQYTAPAYQMPYTTPLAQRKLMRRYFVARIRAMMCKSKEKLFCNNLDTQSTFVWITSEFEMFISFSPLTSKRNIMVVASK
eukprot:gene12507-2282_t